MNSHNSQHVHSLSPIVFLQPQPLPQAPYNATSSIHIQPLPAYNAHSPIQIPNNATPPPIHLPHPLTVHTATAPLQQVQHISLANSSLPSTKDVPLPTGKHDWGPWHLAVRTLILNANILGHIVDDPLLGAVYDPGLWPTYPPSVNQRSSQVELQSFNDWWSRNGVASHILTSRLSSCVGQPPHCQQTHGSPMILSKCLLHATSSIRRRRLLSCYGHRG